MICGIVIKEVLCSPIYIHIRVTSYLVYIPQYHSSSSRVTAANGLIFPVHPIAFSDATYGFFDSFTEAQEGKATKGD